MKNICVIYYHPTFGSSCLWFHEEKIAFEFTAKQGKLPENEAITVVFV
jgi:hypothetical protein